MDTSEKAARLKRRHMTLPKLFSLRRPWIYISISSAAGLILLINFAIMPLVVHGYSTSITPTGPQAEPGLSTSNLLRDLNAQNPGAGLLGYVTHPYLTGRGRLLGFAGDNIQIFEYPTSEMARSEALAIFGRSPRLAAVSNFHLYLRGNLIVLYFGYNTQVLKIAEEGMGSPLVAALK